ncbi:hypothetical protein NPIL_556261 [Nephila pilipes]|uniref:Uncharacterized protein n=1 Tax=Nephila pilipes TaxID=299642 RepID=A0A8X6T841_NEPPI|nr:hypothetical protein NPIL_556241 [Nephila pilipes]GFS87080.1 hypothetical protein NPIL_556261 [Nephila pilipes]
MAEEHPERRIVGSHHVIRTDKYACRTMTQGLFLPNHFRSPVTGASEDSCVLMSKAFTRRKKNANKESCPEKGYETEINHWGYQTDCLVTSHSETALGI